MLGGGGGGGDGGVAIVEAMMASVGVVGVRPRGGVAREDGGGGGGLVGAGRVSGQWARGLVGLGGGGGISSAKLRDSVAYNTNSHNRVT